MQAVLIPIADRHIEAADELAGVLRARGLRVEVDGSDNRMQNKIREAQGQQVPYMLVLGDREIEARTAAPAERARRAAGGGRRGTPSPTGWPRRASANRRVTGPGRSN